MAISRKKWRLKNDFMEKKPLVVFHCCARNRFSAIYQTQLDHCLDQSQKFECGTHSSVVLMETREG